MDTPTHTDAETKRRTVMEKTGSCGKDGLLWKRQAVVEKTDSWEKTDDAEGFSLKISLHIVIKYQKPVKKVTFCPKNPKTNGRKKTM